MPVNSDQTLITILSNKALFFRLMDHVQSDALNHSMEFTISDYENLLVSIGKKFSEVERRRLFDTLSLENLERNGLLNYIDRRTGRFRLQDFILEMLRHLDGKRLRELSSAELNQLMKHLEECYRQVSNPNVMWIAGDDSFEELVESVYYNLQYVASKLKSNVRALKGQTERLASIVDQQEFNDMERTDQVRVALGEILRIHERHVTPTLQFLDERLDIRRSRTELFGDNAPMALVKKIIDRFGERKLSDHVTRLQRIQFHILGMGREVGEIAKGLDSYVKYAEAERRRYNRTEQLYTALKEAVQEKQTGQFRDYLLKPSHPVFRSVSPLGEIKNFCRAQSANINWPTERGTFALDEILRVRIEAEQSKPKLTISNTTEPVSEKEVAERQVINRILQAMKKYNFSQSRSDSYLSVHEHLAVTMDGYSLEQLLDAIPFLSGRGEVMLAHPPEMRQLDYRGLKLCYRKRIFHSNEDRNKNTTWVDR